MTSTLELAFVKASKLSQAAQDQLGLEVLEWIAALERLQAELDIGIRQADAGLAEPLDIEEFIKEMREEHAGR